MTCTECIVLTLRHFCKSRYSTGLTKRIEHLLTAREYFMGVRLMSYVEYDVVLRRIKNAMHCNGKLHNAEVGREMPARFIHFFYKELPYLTAKLRNISRRYNTVRKRGLQLSRISFCNSTRLTM